MTDIGKYCNCRATENISIINLIKEWVNEEKIINGKDGGLR